MTHRIFFTILFSIALILGASTQAAAQSEEQQTDSQQQTSQQDQQEQPKQQDQQQQQDQHKQQSSDQSGNGQATESGENAAAQDQQTQGQNQQGLFITAQKSSQVLASSIMGLSIQNSTGTDAEEIGTVDDLIMNQQHQLVGVVVGIGGFLGIGEKKVGIKLDAVQNIDPEKDVAVVTVTKEQLENAPVFTTKDEQKRERKQDRAQQKMEQQQQKLQQQQLPEMGQQPQAPAPMGEEAAPAEG